MRIITNPSGCDTGVAARRPVSTYDYPTSFFEPHVWQINSRAPDQHIREAIEMLPRHETASSHHRAVVCAAPRPGAELAEFTSCVRYPEVGETHAGHEPRLRDGSANPLSMGGTAA